MTQRLLKNLSPEYVRECLDYDADTGQLTWRTRPLHHFSDTKFHRAWNTKFAGKRAGSVNCKGYVTIGIGRAHYQAHRLLWVIVHGVWPPEDIDHINRDAADNRLVNLRAVSHRENSRNLSLSRNNSSGHKGVSFQKARQKWQATISNKSLGRFETFEMAAAARLQAEIEYGYRDFGCSE